MRFSGKRWLAGLLAFVLLQQQLVPGISLAEELSSGEAAAFVEDAAYSVMSSDEDLSGADEFPEDNVLDEGVPVDVDAGGEDEGESTRTVCHGRGDV